jgi:hypothetical protein
MMTEAHVHALVNLKNESVVVISDKYVNKKVKRLACFLYAPGWAEQKEVCKRELKGLLEDPRSAPHLIYHTAATTTPRICLAHVLRMT